MGILDDNVPEESKCVNVTFAPHHGASATMTLPHASYQCPGYWEQANAKFDVKQVGTQVTLTRTDGSQGWPALTIQLKCCDTGCVTIEVDFTSGSSSVTTPSYAALQPDGWRQYRMRLTVPPTKRSQHSRARTHAPRLVSIDLCSSSVRTQSAPTYLTRRIGSRTRIRRTPSMVCSSDPMVP